MKRIDEYCQKNNFPVKSAEDMTKNPVYPHLIARKFKD